MHSARSTHRLSIYQTDIIIYGTDIVDYVGREFTGAESLISSTDWTPPPMVPFWSEFL